MLKRKGRALLCFLLMFAFLVSGCVDKDEEKLSASLPKLPVLSTKKVKIACVGDSITYGATLVQQKRDNYPHQLNLLLGKNVQVENFGVDGAAAQKQTTLSYWDCQAYIDSLAYQPDVLFFMLGTNDTKIQNWQSAEAFKNDYLALLKSYQQQFPNLKIYLMLPSTMYSLQADGSLIHGFSQEHMKQVLSVIRKISKEEKLPLIDIHEATANHANNYQYDGIHPNAQGAKLIAETTATVYLQDMLKTILKTYVDWEIKASKVLLQTA